MVTLASDNYRIECNEDYIKIELIGSDEGTSVAYRFFLKIFISIQPKV